MWTQGTKKEMWSSLWNITTKPNKSETYQAPNASEAPVPRDRQNQVISEEGVMSHEKRNNHHNLVEPLAVPCSSIRHSRSTGVPGSFGLT
jgi:hypothetical protein